MKQAVEQVAGMTLWQLGFMIFGKYLEKIVNNVDSSHISYKPSLSRQIMWKKKFFYSRIGVGSANIGTQAVAPTRLRAAPDEGQPASEAGRQEGCLGLTQP